MGQVRAENTVTLTAPPATVAEALADYTGMRPRIQPENYSAYRVLEGGQGDGTVAAWNLQATKKRNRDVEAAVSVTTSGETTTIVEDDRNSSMSTTYVVAPSGAGSKVTVTTAWTGAGGVGGFFEKTFAPGGLRKIQQAQLDNLVAELDA